MENKKLGIIIPFRKRENHLKQFIPHMKKFLQNFDYEIVVIEQIDEKPFNRAKLMNVGFDILKNEYDYFCFHDVDLLPIQNADYSYVEFPTHLARLLDYLGWKVHYEELFGGVTMFNKKDFQQVNGFSNEYWGWGGEDDDLRLRCVKEKLKVGKRKNKYKSLPHPRTGPAHPNYTNNRNKMRNFRDTPANNYYKNEGLNTLQYSLQKTIIEDGFKRVKVLL